MNVLLSIKPEFAYKIFDGTKKYEFRRNIFKNKDVRRILVYASSPVQRIIGEFEISAILHEDIETLWNITRHASGITREYYIQYFEDKTKAFAIEIGTTVLYGVPLSLSDINVSCAPQSFYYLTDKNQLDQIEKIVGG